MCPLPTDALVPSWQNPNWARRPTQTQSSLKSEGPRENRENLKVVQLGTKGLQKREGLGSKQGMQQTWQMSPAVGEGQGERSTGGLGESHTQAVSTCTGAVVNCLELSEEVLSGCGQWKHVILQNPFSFLL